MYSFYRQAVWWPKPLTIGGSPLAYREPLEVLLGIVIKEEEYVGWSGVKEKKREVSECCEVKQAVDEMEEGGRGCECVIEWCICERR